MRFSARKLTTMAVLTAVALVIFVVEAQIPLPVPIPGVKLGLANAVTLFALFYGSGKEKSAAGLTTLDAFLMLVCRIVLGAALTGRLVAFVYSIAGGLLAFTAQAAMKRLVTKRQIWVCGAVGAVFHNIGQIAAAMLIMRTTAIITYLPVLTMAGIVTGVFTGLVAQFTLSRLSHTPHS